MKTQRQLLEELQSCQNATQIVTLFCQAITEGEKEIVHLSQIHLPRKSGQTAMHLLAVHGKEEELRMLIDWIPEVDRSQALSVADDEGNQPLHAALQINKVPSTAIVLIQKGASLTAVNKLKESPMHIAGTMGRHQFLLTLSHAETFDERYTEVIQACGQALYQPDSNNNIPLYCALMHQNQNTAIAMFNIDPQEKMVLHINAKQIDAWDLAKYHELTDFLHHVESKGIRNDRIALSMPLVERYQGAARLLGMERMHDMNAAGMEALLEALSNEIVHLRRRLPEHRDAVKDLNVEPDKRAVRYSLV